VQFKTEGEAEIAGKVEHRAPAAGEFAEGLVDEPGRALRPRVGQMPRESAREDGHALGAEPGGGAERQAELLAGPGDAAGIVESLRIERLEGRGVGRMDRHDLTGERGIELGDDETMTREAGAPVVAVGRRLGGARQVDQSGRFPGRHLHALVAESGGPAAQAVERVERRLRADELREEDRGALDGIWGRHRGGVVAASDGHTDHAAAAVLLS